MSILDFGHMNNDDEATFVAMLVGGAVDHLRAHGHPDEADKALALFKSRGPNSGTNQFALFMMQYNTINTRNAENPNNRKPEFEVEDAMEHTLQSNGIDISAADLRAIGKGFQPVGPPRGALATPYPWQH
jgi:hypothetical protein